MAGYRWVDLPQKLETRSRTRRSSLRRNTDQPSPSRRSPSRRSPERLDSSQRSPERRSPERRNSRRRSSTRRSFEQRSPDRSRRRHRSNLRDSDQLSPDRNNRKRRGSVLQSPVRFDYTSIVKTIRPVPAGSPNAGQRSPGGLCTNQNSPDRRSPKWRSPKRRSLEEGSSCRRTSGQRTPAQNNFGQRSGHRSPSRQTSSPYGFHPDFDIMRDNMQIFLQRMNLCNCSTVSKDKLAKAEKGLRVWIILYIYANRDPFCSLGCKQTSIHLNFAFI